MKNSKMFDAMSKIDEKYINRAARKRAAASTEKETPVRKNSARYLTAAAAAVLIFAITLSAVLIANRPADTDGQPLMIGFDTESRPVLGARLAIKTEKQKIALGEDLKISAYCVCGTKDDTAKDVTAKLLMSYSRIDPDNMIETVKEIDDGKESGYTWNGSFKTMKSINITVPASAFTKAEVNDGEDPPETDGVVVLALDVSKEYSDGTENEEKDSAALYYKIEGDEVYLNVSDETMELARAAVEKLYIVFDTSVHSIPTTLSEVYNRTAAWVAPEVNVLETKKDAASAFIRVYEDILTEYRSCDIEWFYSNLKTGFNKDNETKAKVFQIIKFQGMLRAVEALLALDCYYDMLTEVEIERMLKDFDEYFVINNEYIVKTFGEESRMKEPMFYHFRKANGENNYYM